MREIRYRRREELPIGFDLQIVGDDRFERLVPLLRIRLHQVNAKLMADQQYWKLIEKAAKAELFIDGSIHDIVTRQV